MALYKVIFTNNSSVPGDACLFQKNSKQDSWESLAWFSYVTNIGVSNTFNWDDTSYGFMWSAESIPATKSLISLRTANQVLSANLTTENFTELKMNDYGYYFDPNPATQGTSSGTLTYAVNINIPTNSASIGITMSNNPAFGMTANPNTTSQFTPDISYWITFGNIPQSAVMESLWIESAAEIIFPANIYTMYANLSSQNIWTISQTPINE
ncbi:hypothetical protein [Pseudoalteromonas denitrificans]|jgi:hypothetical protein|uniref:Uncharacterized protein n=1 Tax=Pseudoalteromonas denitrificans DSM 6059 TaxID=1123010 RepID=A0A1I1P0P9_9GAMM|nr:hypothetical protein [Pseudoalteromonas denitrificans]SFD00543.1 hypothetical protein SAMN02745724_03167 [Pseudoalteromonas denitrificans DSM 6059]